MSAAVNIVLKKVFSGGFYRSHSGLLLFLFSILASYFFLINTLGTVRPEDIDFWQLFFTLNIAGNPIFTLLFCLICIVYAYKAFQYVAAELSLEKHFFLSYCLTSLTKAEQLKGWLIVYLKILLPVVIFVIYTLIVGFIFSVVLVPILLCVFIFLMILVCSLLTVRITNSARDKALDNWVFPLGRFYKPLWLLYVYQVAYGTKLMFVVSKLLSFMLLWAVPKLILGGQDDDRILLLTSATIVMTHAILLFQERRFSESFLSFSLNFPLNITSRFFGPLINYGILLLPELLWMLSSFSLMLALGSILFIFSAISLFRSILHLPALTTKAYLSIIFALFFLYYVLIMFGFGWLAIPLNFMVSMLIFRVNYKNE